MTVDEQQEGWFDWRAFWQAYDERARLAERPDMQLLARDFADQVGEYGRIEAAETVLKCVFVLAEGGVVTFGHRGEGPYCKALTQQGSLCRNLASGDRMLCGRHRAQRARYLTSRPKEDA